MDPNNLSDDLKPNSPSENRILSWPKSERPRERLIQSGATALSLTELVAILLGTGTGGINVIEVARGIVQSLENLPIQEITFAELKTRKGVGESKAARVIAAIELGKRLSVETRLSSVSIKTSQQAFEFLKPRIANQMKEVFVAVSLDIKNRPISYDEIASGSSETVTFLP